MSRLGRMAVLASLIALAAPAVASSAPSTTPSPLCCTPHGSVQAIAVSGSTAYVGGYFRHVGPVTGSFAGVDGAEGRLEGSRWPQVDGLVRAIVADGSGGWYLAGFFTTVGGVARDGLAHLRGDGTLDPDWAPTTDGSAFAIALFGDRVYIGGSFTEVNGGTARKNLAAFDRTSGAVTAVAAGGGANGVVHAFAVRPGGQTMFDAPARLYVGGEFSQIDGQARGHIASYDANGSLTATWAGTGFNGTSVRALHEVNVGTGANPNWRLYVAGEFSLFGPVDSRSGLASFDENDTITAWTPTGPGPFIYSLASGSGRIYVGGSFGVRAFDRNTGASAGWSPNLGFSGQALALLARGDTVYVGGQMFEVGAPGVRRTNAAAFSASDAAVVRPWDPEPGGGGIFALAGAANGGIVLAGDFAAAGGTPRHHLAAFDLLTGELAPFDPDLDREVRALDVSGGRVYAGGAFTTVNGGTPRARIAAFDAATGVATAFDPGPDGAVETLDAASGTLYAAGAFTHVSGGLARAGIAAWDTDSGALRDFQPSFSFYVNEFEVRDATVFMGGSFLNMAGTDRDNLASVRDVPGTSGAPTFFAPAPDSFVLGMELDGDRVYAGGQFDNVGTPPQPRGRLAAFDATTGAAVPWDASVNGLVVALAKAGDQIVVGGSIAEANGQPRSNLAAFQTGAGGVADWGPAIDANVESMAASPGAGLIVGGSFARVDGALSGPLAAFALAPEAPAAPIATGADGAANVTVTPPAAGGAPITSYTLTVAPGGRTVTGPGPAFAVGGLANGTAYTFTATATNRVGTSPPSAPSNAVTPNPVPGAGGNDTTAPVISALRIKPKRFAVGKRKTARSARAKRGSAFRFSLSEDAVTRLTIARRLAGRRKGGRCVKPRKGLRRKCTRFKAVHTLARARTVAGANKVAYTGRVGKRRLKPGRYRATLVATDASGNRSQPGRVAFRVVRR